MKKYTFWRNCIVAETFVVEAETEEEAIEKAIQQHEDMPDGDWEAMIDPYDSNNFGDK